MSDHSVTLSDLLRPCVMAIDDLRLGDLRLGDLRLGEG